MSYDLFNAETFFFSALRISDYMFLKLQVYLEIL